MRSPNGTLIINSPLIGNDNASITLNGATALSANITTNNQPIAIQGNVTLGSNPITLSTGDAPITLTGFVNGNQPLTLNSGIENITISDAIGSVNPVGDLTANSSGITTFGGPISAGSLTTNVGGTTNSMGMLPPRGCRASVWR